MSAVQTIMLIILAIQITLVITVAIINPILKKMRKRLNEVIIYEDPFQSRAIYKLNKKKCDRLEKARNIIKDKLIEVNHYIILVLAIIQLIMFAI